MKDSFHDSVRDSHDSIDHHLTLSQSYFPSEQSSSRRIRDLFQQPEV